MSRFLLFFFFQFILAAPAAASVELALSGQPPVTISEVYLHDGVSYLAIDEVLPALNLSGRWDSVEHVYRIKTLSGTAVISPGSHYLRRGERFAPLEYSPCFIDGRLRVAEDFVTTHLSALLDQPIYFRNLNPQAVKADVGDTPLDRLFAFLLRKKRPDNGPVLRGVAIDPGHGGQDPGCLGINGIKEKEVALEVAKRLEKLLKMRLGIPVYLSRNGDYFLNRQQRLETANRPEVDAFILLHTQSSYSAAPQGVTFIIRPQEESKGGSLPGGEGESMRLAGQLSTAFKEAGFVVAGVYRAPLLPLGRGNLPTVLVELGYLSNPGDQALLRDPGGQEKLAIALFEGLKNFTDGQKEFHE
jgi:N-acetylmuramoyl-L-alanine amidase